jgi:hypothetical protein
MWGRQSCLRAGFRTGLTQREDKPARRHNCRPHIDRSHDIERGGQSLEPEPQLKFQTPVAGVPGEGSESSRDLIGLPE